MSPPSCPAGPSRPAPWSASTCRSPPPCSARATTPSPRTSCWTPPRRRPRPPFLRMAKFGPEPDRWLATVVPDREGLLDLPRRGVERPAGHLAPRRRGEGRGRPGRRGAGQRPRGGRPAARPGRRPRPTPSTSDGVAAAAAALRDTSPGADRPDRPGARRRRCSGTCTSTRCASWSPRPPSTRSGSTGRARSTAPGTSSSRARRGRSSAARPPTARSPTPQDRLPGHRRHGLRRRLPAADPPDRHGEPQGPEHSQFPAATRTIARTTSARRGRSAATRAGTTPSTRSWARWTTSGPSSPAPASWAWRWRWTSRCRRRRTTRGSQRTRSGSPPSPTARSPTRRTRRRSTRTSTRSTSTTTPRASTPSACG